VNPVIIAQLVASVPRLFVTGGRVEFSQIARAFSLFLGFAGLILTVVFVFFLPATGRLPLSAGLTFVGLLFTAASFFANAGRPDSPQPIVVNVPGGEPLSAEDVKRALPPESR
jgi:hypothetical protein